MEIRTYSAAELPLRNGRVYHLDLAPEELASDIILVGDPDRVPYLADEFFSVRETDRCNRGFRTITGLVRETGRRVTFTTSGIGTASTEIVLNELVALNEFDLVKRRRKKSFEPLTIVRIGTCGGLQPETDLGTLIVTDYGIGLDNTGFFYDAPLPDAECGLLERRVRSQVEDAVADDVRFRGRFNPYAARADVRLRVALEREALHLGVPCKRGVTVTSPGFFAEQGRPIGRVSPTIPNLVDVLAAIDTGIAGLKIENIEMEASFLLHFFGAIGYRAGVVCAVIDKRQEGVFLTEYRDSVRGAAWVALRAFNALRPSQL
ncbi:MAG: nucleoside phosphorylase [Geobacteraceae bacterium]|nr:nucleoside phosphorylase [Geobacteraceae bacterium]